MSDSPRSPTEASKDLNDQNELDYDDELENNSEEAKQRSREIKKSHQSPGHTNKVNQEEEEQQQQQVEEKEEKNEPNEESDGEIKSSNGSMHHSDDGEVLSPKERKADKKEREEPEEEEEDGEINDGEKVKKAFIPRVLCKYYQRGKCTWGRTCKFLHPGVNDTGNYSFLEFQDPNAKVYQQQMAAGNDADRSAGYASIKQDAEALKTETAWERGLRHAKEMKEKALQRKLVEKDQFDDKKMNLSLKEFENEKENDERYFNIEKPMADEDMEDEDLSMYTKSGRMNERASAAVFRSGGYNDDRYSNDHSRRSGNTSSFDYKSKQQSGDYRVNKSKTRGSMSPRANRQRADEWHDPWDRSRQSKKDQQKRDRSNSYSSSSSDSRSRSRSRSDSRSSYSSRSSNSNRSSSRSSQSDSDSNSRNKRRNLQRSKDPDASKSKSAANAKQLTNDLKKKIANLKKPLPGRQISDVSLKKAGIETDKSSAKKNLKSKAASKSRSDSSASSYESSDSDSDEEASDEDLDSYSDDDNEDKSKRSGSKKSKSGLKRSAQDSKIGSDSKKSKLSSEKSASTSDKKQMIKDQLKLLASALIKKKNLAK